MTALKQGLLAFLHWIHNVKKSQYSFVRMKESLAGQKQVSLVTQSSVVCSAVILAQVSRLERRSHDSDLSGDT